MNTSASVLPQVNGVVLAYPNERLTTGALGQRACAELLRQARPDEGDLPLVLGQRLQVLAHRVGLPVLEPVEVGEIRLEERVAPEGPAAALQDLDRQPELPELQHRAVCREVASGPIRGVGDSRRVQLPGSRLNCSTLIVTRLIGRTTNMSSTA